MDTFTTTEARESLSPTLARFRDEGEAAEPLIFGDRRRAEGVVLPYSVYQKLEPLIEQMRFEAATSVLARIETVLADPATAVQVKRHRSPSRG